MKTIRLDKFLSDSTPLSRKEAVKAIRCGRVKVNDDVIKDNDLKIDKEADNVYFDGELLTHRENYYIMMNKPAGYLSATEDKYDKTVLELISDDYPKNKLFPAGRLDKDTEGFLFLTTDGDLAHRITGPKNHVAKKYYVVTDLKQKETLKEKFLEGMTLENGEVCKPAYFSLIDEHSSYLTLTEGKFHQVKRMFSMSGLTVTYLKRVSIGEVELDASLKPGEYRELSDDEVKKICLKKS